MRDITQMLKMDADWYRVYEYDVIRVGMPVCRYCGMPTRKGSWADPYWPYFDMSYHESCRRRDEKELQGLPCRR